MKVYYPKWSFYKWKQKWKQKDFNEDKIGFKPNYKCLYNKDKIKCEEVQKECSEYNGGCDGFKFIYRP